MLKVLRGVVGVVLAKSHNLTSAFAVAEQCTICLVRQSSPRGSGLRNFQREGSEEKSCSNETDIQEG
ncbi:hypothetical protein B296_00052657 [Ensete ventricosum]|uniref:Uncharacterized protein n=1 Tax=Ensete ventricosum TaxID=4639 RepID=A0A426YBH6_ENSVE|nr:hypothetical protein B296_00052657 [Ensete ventricosum]